MSIGASIVVFHQTLNLNHREEYATEITIHLYLLVFWQSFFKLLIIQVAFSLSISFSQDSEQVTKTQAIVSFF